MGLLSFWLPSPFLRCQPKESSKEKKADLSAVLFVLLLPAQLLHLSIMSMDIKMCINVLERGEWCSMEVIQANINKGDGGKLLVLARCRIARKQFSPVSSTISKKTSIGNNKNPNHGLNFTRNIELPGNQVITIHPALIHKINKEFVV